MVMPPRIAQAPSPEQLVSSLVDFTRTIEAVTHARARAFGPQWLAESQFLGETGVGDAQRIFDDVAFFEWLTSDIARAPTAYAILWAELFALNYAHKGLSGVVLDEDEAPIEVIYLQTEEVEPSSERAVKDLETAQGSVEKIIDRLPPWLKKLMEAMMELLKLSRGVIG